MDHVTQVHHAVVDLYEVEDRDAVTAQDVATRLGCTVSSVAESFEALERQHVLKLDAEGVVYFCKNNGYFPLSLVQK